MTRSKQTRRPAGRPGEAEQEASRTRQVPHRGSDLEELDAFLEKVLEEAGEEFLDEFRQIEGE